MEETTSPTQARGRNTSIRARPLLPTPSFLSLCGCVARLAHTYAPSLISSSSDGFRLRRRYILTSPSIWRRQQKKYVFGGDLYFFESEYFHSASISTSANREWYLRASESPISRAWYLQTRIVPGSSPGPKYVKEQTGTGAGTEPRGRRRKRGQEREQEKDRRRRRERERVKEGGGGKLCCPPRQEKIREEDQSLLLHARHHLYITDVAHSDS